MMKSRIGFTIILALVLLGAVSSLMAAPVNDYRIDWWTIDNGGDVSVAGRYAVRGTIGQFDASAPLHGGVYALTGGYWGGGYYTIFLPVVLREV